MTIALLNDSSSQPPSLAQVSEVLCSRAARKAHHVSSHGQRHLRRAPGGGKTLIMMSPLVIADAMGQRGKAFIIVPTKILADQQVRRETSHLASTY